MGDKVKFVTKEGWVKWEPVLIHRGVIDRAFYPDRAVSFSSAPGRIEEAHIVQVKRFYRVERVVIEYHEEPPNG